MKKLYAIQNYQPIQDLDAHPVLLLYSILLKIVTATIFHHHEKCVSAMLRFYFQHEYSGELRELDIV